MNMEPPALVSDAILSPFLKGSNKRKMLIPRSHYSHLLVHYHMTTGTLAAKVVEQDAPLSGPDGEVPEIPGAIYGGVLFHNFGHFLTESIHRLWPLFLEDTATAAPILFHVPGIKAQGDYLAPFMIEILEYLRVDWRRIIVIDKPIRVRSLTVAKQAKLLGAPALPGYNALLAKFAPPQENGRSETAVYVSRTRFIHSGSYIGETFVERRLRACGFHIHYPEDHSLRATLALYRSARNIIFSEGSAVHALEIMGHVDANVLVIGRRTAEFIQQIFIDPLKPCCRSIEQFGIENSITPLHWDEAKDRPTISKASAIVNLNGLLRKIADMTGVDIPEFMETEIADAIMIDVYKTLFQGPIHPDLQDDRIGKLIRLLKKDLAEIGF